MKIEYQTLEFDLNGIEEFLNNYKSTVEKVKYLNWIITKYKMADYPLQKTELGVVRNYKYSKLNDEPEYVHKEQNIDIFWKNIHYTIDYYLNIPSTKMVKKADDIRTLKIGKTGL